MKQIKLCITFIALCIFSLSATASPGIVEALNTANPEVLASFIASHSMLIYLGIFFALGVLLSFTPCVLPMVPILSGIIIKEHKHKGFRLSLAFVAGMSITYATAGMLFGFLGHSLQSVMQSPLFIISFSLIFIALALNLFGVFEFRMSSGQQKILTTNGSYLKTGLMGALSTLIVSPCVTAPLIGVLTFISQSQQVLLGGLILFVLSLGMSLPLLLVGAGLQNVLPKSGAWMSQIKTLFGVLMLGMAIMLLSRIMPVNITQILIAALIILAGLLFGYQNQKSAVVLFFFMPLLVGIGSLKLYRPLLLQAQETQIVAKEAHFVAANSVQDIEAILTKAKKDKKPVFIEFFATWCSDCKAFHAKVLEKPKVISALDNSVNIKVDISDDNPRTKAIMKAFHIYGTPSLRFFSPNGEVRRDLNTSGFIGASDFLLLLHKLAP